MGLISRVSFLSSAQSLWHSPPLWQTRSTLEAKSKLSPPAEQQQQQKKKSSETNQKKPSFMTGNLIITCSRIALKPQV